jgi:riboflavin kinase/FMN adenylyltransferase
MKVWSIHEYLEIPRPVATIGIFDGVHTGHRYILDQLKQEAAAHDGASVVVSLWPHPRIVLNRDVEHFRLLHTREEKIRELEKAGVDHLVMIPFDKELASLTACEFTRQFLVDRLGVKVLLLGYDNSFGRDRKGDPAGLALCAEKNAFRIQKLPEYQANEASISSTSIREAITKGSLKEANSMLGYPYYLSGSVVEGNHIGRKMGFPTANVHPLDPYKLIPMNGVYAIKAELRGQVCSGMLNIGFRPTIDSAAAVKTIEAHLFDIDGDFYGEHIVIHFIHRVRDEMKFSGLEALKAQLKRDKAYIQHYLSG